MWLQAFQRFNPGRGRSFKTIWVPMRQWLKEWAASEEQGRDHGIVSGLGTVRPNSQLSQLTPGLNLIHITCSMITLIEDLQEGIKSPPPGLNYCADWRSSITDHQILLSGEKRDCVKRAKQGCLKASFWIHQFRITLSNRKAFFDMLRQSFSTGNTTVLALRQDVRSTFHWRGPWPREIHSSRKQRANLGRV